eukprot:scaffold1224_cov67-Isochrysis_galbana.AAC.1
MPCRQPLLSSSVLLSLRSGPLAAGVHTHENQAHLHDLRLAMFILSVAHTVVVVQVGDFCVRACHCLQ